MHPDDAARYADSLSSGVVLSTPFPAPGADAFRWLFYSQSPPWNNTRLSLKAILEGQREFLFRLKNVHQFYLLNRPLDGGGTHIPALPSGAHPLDGWILHALDALVRDTTAGLDAYRIFEPARAINAFVDTLSNWWLRRSRDRFDGDSSDSLEVRHTLHYVLVTLSRLIAPFVPFQAEAMHQSLRLAAAGGAGASLLQEESVHLTDWPAPDDRWLAPELADDMELVRELANLGRSARERVGVPVRQPLASAEVVLADPRRAARLEPLLSLLRDELNVRAILFSSDANRLVTFAVKPDFKVLGARLGKDMKAVAAAIGQMDGSELRNALAKGAVTVGGYALTDSDVRVEVAARAGFQASGSAAAVVALTCTLDEDLLEEGLFREIASRIQAIRKEIGCGYGEIIDVHLAEGAVAGSELVGRGARMFERFSAALFRDTRSRFVASWGGSGEGAEGEPGANIWIWSRRA